MSTLGGSDYASDSPIFLASAQDDPSREYVLKMALRDDLVSGLAAEYIAYSTHLQSLQGGLVPICYGLYVSDQPVRTDEPPSIGVLVLSYVGTSLPVAFPQLPDLVKCVPYLNQQTLLTLTIRAFLSDARFYSHYKNFTTQASFTETSLNVISSSNLFDLTGTSPDRTTSRCTSSTSTQSRRDTSVQDWRVIHRASSYRR